MFPVKVNVIQLIAANKDGYNIFSFNITLLTVNFAYQFWFVTSIPWKENSIFQFSRIIVFSGPNIGFSLSLDIFTNYVDILQEYLLCCRRDALDFPSVLIVLVVDNCYERHRQMEMGAEVIDADSVDIVMYNTYIILSE